MVGGLASLSNVRDGFRQLARLEQIWIDDVLLN